MNVSTRFDGTSYCLGQFRKNVGSGVVHDRVDRVQTEAVEMVLSQPVQSIVDEEVPHRPALCAIEIDCVAPRSMVVIGEKLRSVEADIISLRAKVVVDDIQENHHPADMRGLNQLLEVA